MPDASADMLWATVWGIHASWVLCAMAAFVETIIALPLSMVDKPLPFEYIGFALLAAVVLSPIHAHYSTASWAKSSEGLAEINDMENNRYLPCFKGREGTTVDWNRIPVDQRAGFVKSSQMSQYAYRVLPLVGVGTIVLSVVVGAINATQPIPGLK